MNGLHALYHLARADFLERTRRYSFLLMLGMVVWLGYASATGILILRVPPNYVGEINAPWVGALMTLTATLFLGWFGFYLVKGSVSRDYQTGVGQIMATTPLSRPLYMLGKWLSNLTVLSLMILILMVAGILMSLLVGTSPVDVWALIAPLLLIALPCLAIVSAVAVLFEATGWLRGGFGNIVYLFMFAMLMIPTIESNAYQPLLDFPGIRLIGDGIESAAKAAYPESNGGFAFTVGTPVTDSTTSPTFGSQPFVYDGIAWNASVVLSRFFFLFLAFGIAVLAAALFDRFNSAQALRVNKKGDTSKPSNADVSDASSVSQAHLAPLTEAPNRLRFGALYIVELKLLLKGHRWWWYVVTLGLITAQFATGRESTRMLLAIAWLWPVLLLSGLGSREARHNTYQIVFSAPRPVLNQLPAVWLATYTVIALMGSGAFLRFLLDGETTSLLAWLGSAVFIPSLALAMGVLTGSGKTFEVVYTIWMYIVLQGVPPLDFVGVTPTSPWYVYSLLAPGLVALTAFARQWQLTAKSIS